MFLRAVIVLHLLCGLASAVAAGNDSQPEILVLASQLRAADLQSVPAGITVLDRATVSQVANQHFEELIPLVPNLNWSGEGSRARYLQIRGTGELEQYQGAPNPSVGFLIDDIDLSGLGGAATSFDVDRIEVLRGPQGTRYGANALAGLVYVTSAQPTFDPEAEATATIADYGTLAAGGVVSGPVPGFGESLAGRVGIHQYSSDGFRHNAFEGRDDTSNRDELTARAKLLWRPSATTTVQLTALHVDLDNGYDDFALDNGFTTRSDRPGEDSQVTDAVALRAALPLGRTADLLIISTAAFSESVYAFDADWGNPAYWAPDVYEFTTAISRERATVTQELRFTSRPGSQFLGADWLAGIYLLDLTEDIAEAYTGKCPATTCPPVDIDYDEADTAAASRYEATNLAVYGELGWALGDATRLQLGLRREVRHADYAAGSGLEIAPVDRMWGGDLTLTHGWTAGDGGIATVWARVARGYKAGGFNPSVLGTPDQQRLKFGPESLWNYELGARGQSVDARWWGSASVFLQQRRDQQVKVPAQSGDDPNTFVFLTENAERGRIRGLELEARWRPRVELLDDRLTLGATIGLLDTEIEEFMARPALEGREQAHAPPYMWSINGTWRTAHGWFARADYGVRGRFFIDYCQVDQQCAIPDPKTADYRLLELRVGREWGAWSLAAWCRNVLDDDYAVRGFYFGNEPPDFTPTLYTRPGDPRQAGLTINYTW